MKIPPKTKGEIGYYLDKIKQVQFDQETLTGLLMTIRESAKQGSLTREIADFIAHPERDRGIILGQIGQLKFGIDVVNGRQRMKIILPNPRDGAELVKDLCATLKSIGEDTGPIERNHDGVLLCYFGVLHLAQMLANDGQLHTLKISHSHSYHEPTKTEYISLVSISKDGTVLLIFNSNLNAKTALGDLRLKDRDVQTILRVLRHQNGLKIVEQTV